MAHSFRKQADTDSLSNKLVICFHVFSSNFLIRLLTFLFLLAAVVKVDVLGGEFQAAGHHVHHRHQLAVLPQHQFLLLACLLRFNPVVTEREREAVKKYLTNS